MTKKQTDLELPNRPNRCREDRLIDGVLVWLVGHPHCGTQVEVLVMSINRHIGKVVIVTGANSGIGFEAAKDLAQRGAFVIAACRNVDKGSNVVKKIINLSNNKDVYFIQLDLASFASIKKFVDKIFKSVSRVDILINNAGVYTTSNNKTEDGFSIGMQVNYLGPFLLTSLLLPILRKSTPSRIVNVSSMLYQFGRINFKDIESNRSLNAFATYCNAKLCTILMTVELHRRLQGTGVTVNCLHPGMVNTEMIDSVNIIFIKEILKIFKIFFKTSWEGAQTTIYLSVSPDVENVSGCYFKDCRIANVKPKAQELVVAQKLWDISEKNVKLK
ncbi:retinol dehydrogenase 11-like [Nymphalis io]|uniref:retinol dehydrogenase 11-like n=1 Tax=Inachis io TaxID=171585 RepID=UPI00216A4773|nr:retinol dehydrogenase 11-like [Nymphalis io]